MSGDIQTAYQGPSDDKPEIPAIYDLRKAIRLLTVDMPNDEPNGKHEADIEALRFALARGDIQAARKHYRTFPTCSERCARPRRTTSARTSESR